MKILAEQKLFEVANEASLGSDGINSLDQFEGESCHVICHCGQGDQFHRFVVLLDHFKIQGSLIGSPKVGIGALHDLLLDLVLQTSYVQLYREVPGKRLLGISPRLFADIVGTHGLRHGMSGLLAINLLHVSMFLVKLT